MHELSIAGEIIDIVRGEMARLNLNKIEKINLRLGALSSVNSEALSFGFKTSISGTPLEGAELVIEDVPIKGRCRSCGKTFEVMEFLFMCPHCDGTDLEIIEGEELEIDSLVGK